MTLDGDPTEKNTDEVQDSPNDETAVVGAPRQEVELTVDEVFERFASALLEGGEAFDMTTHAVLAQRSGPLPPPQMLQDYNGIIPDGANRIMLMAEKAQSADIDDRHEMRRAERRGQYFAFVCVLAVLATGLVLTAVGREVVGSSIAVSSLAAMVYAFVRGRG